MKLLRGLKLVKAMITTKLFLQLHLLKDVVLEVGFHVFSSITLVADAYFACPWDITSMTYLYVIGRSHEIPFVVRVYVS